MIDTIAAMSPPLDEKVFNQLKQNSKTRLEIDNSTGEQRSLAYQGYVYNILGIPIKYNLYKSGKLKVRLEASVHKLMVGHNVWGGPKDFHASVAYLVAEFERLMGIELPPFMDWTVQRVDMEEFYRLKSQSQCKAWFHSLRDVYFPRRRIRTYGNHSIYIPGNTTVLKFYNKGMEIWENIKNRKRLLNHMGKIDFGTFLYRAYKIIKVEVEINRAKLVYDLGKDFTVKDVSNTYLEETHDMEVNKFMKDINDAWTLVRTSDDVFNRLNQLHKPLSAAVLFEFWMNLSHRGENKVRESMPKSTFNKHIKELKEAGIDWKKSIISGPKAYLIPAEFSPVRGNKYHYDAILPEVEAKLKPYLQAMEIKRTPVITIPQAAMMHGLSENHILNYVKQGWINYYMEKDQRLIIADDKFLALGLFEMSYSDLPVLQD